MAMSVLVYAMIVNRRATMVMIVLNAIHLFKECRYFIQQVKRITKKTQL